MTSNPAADAAPAATDAETDRAFTTARPCPILGRSSEMSHPLQQTLPRLAPGPEQSFELPSPVR